MAKPPKPKSPKLDSLYANVEESPNFAMGLLYQFVAHSSGLAFENATINANVLNTVNTANGTVLSALKNAEAAAISVQKTTISESYNAQTAVTGLNSVTNAGATALSSQTSQQIAGITADAIAATAVAMDAIVKKMGG